MSSDWLNSEMLYDTNDTKTTKTDSNSETSENVILFINI